MRPIEQYRVVLFDCDGVILDSNPAKVEAFAAVLADQPAALVERFLARHQAMGGVSRYEKLRWFFTELAPSDDPERAMQDAAARFSAACRVALETVPIVPGVRDVLERLRVPAYVVSGADQAEVRDVLRARGLADHFTEILGSPAPKEAHLAALERSGSLPAPGLFLGDARKDMEVAEAHGLDFVLVAGFSEWEAGPRVCADRGHRVVRDLAEL